MIEPTRLFAVRHGRTAWNAELRIQGHRDEPLDALGRWQAEQSGLVPLIISGSSPGAGVFGHLKLMQD